MYNKKVLNTAIKNLDKAKAPKQSRDIIVDPRGQWDHPGEVTRIPSNIITMEGVSYPVLGIPDKGEPIMMMPGQYYEFPEAEYVDEYPQMKRGGGTQSYVKLPKKSKKGLKSKAYSKSLEATNRLFTENALFAKSRSRKRKVYDPNAKYYQDGGTPFKTELSPEEEIQFQKFYSSLPENLQQNDPSYDIRGYWDSEGRPSEFDYSQPKEDDGYYHAYSINGKTGEYLKAPWHPTFQHAVDEDRKIGWRPIVNVKGEIIAIENPSIADDYIETELTPEEIEEYVKGGYIIEDISVPSLNQ